MLTAGSGNRVESERQGDALMAEWIGEVMGADSCRLPQGRKGMVGAFIVGLVAGLISSPCATPVLVAILALVAGRANILLGVGLLAAYSLGHSLLLMVAGTSVGWAQQMASSPATERIGRVAKATFGVVVVLIGGYLLYLGIGW